MYDSKGGESATPASEQQAPRKPQESPQTPKSKYMKLINIHVLLTELTALKNIVLLLFWNL